MINVYMSFFILISVICMILFLIKNPNMNLYKWALLIILITYGFCFFLVVFFASNKQLPNDDVNSIINSYSFFDMILYFFLIVLVLLFITIGYKTSNHSKFPRGMNRIFSDTSITFYKKLYRFSFIMLLFSFFCYYLYAKAYGGFIGLLDHTMAVRNGLSSIPNKWSFLQKFGSISYICGYCFCFMTFNKHFSKKSRLNSCFLMILSIMFSCYVALSLGGRGTVFYIFLIYILYFILLNTNNFLTIILKHWKKFILAILAFLLVDLFWNRSGQITNIFVYIAQGFSYLFTSLKVNIDNYHFRYFVDFIIFPLYLLPSSIWSNMGVITANQYTTYLITGGFKGDIVNGKLITGDSTTGILSYSYMQFSIFGVIVIALLFGKLLRKMNERLEQMSDKSFKTMLYSYYIVQFVCLIIVGGDISAIIISNFNYIFFFAFFNFFYRIKLRT